MKKDMQQAKERCGQFVVPGERLGVIEEFMPGPGTYVEQGAVRSKTAGRALMDILNKKVSVYPMVHMASVPRTGSIVVGQVLNVQGKKATLRIFKIGKALLNGFFTGILHVSDVSPSYVETMFDACKDGDILRATVVSTKNRTYQLSTADRNLGVVYAFCSSCGHTLDLKERKMQCSNCGKIENRKVALDYGKGTM